MTDRFADLRKVPPHPAARLLAQANMKLDVQLTSPASAPVPVVLAELDALDAKPDVLKLLAVALPPRETIWWACLAARDVVGAAPAALPRTLQAAEAWVFRPGDDTRAAAETAAELADMDDPSVSCAMAAVYAAGTLGTADRNAYPVSPEILPLLVVKQVAASLSANSARFEDHFRLVVDRALDIARGGNGQVAPPAPEQPSEKEA